MIVPYKNTNMKVIDRNIINSKITFYDITKDGQLIKYSYKEFEQLVDLIKNYFLSNYNIKFGETVLIGYYGTCLAKLASVFACLELGLSISIVDYNITIISPESATKTKLLSPIHYFICEDDEFPKENPKSKYAILVKHCLNTIYFTDIKNHQYNKDLNCKVKIDPKSIAMRCTSSGTTGTPKIIEHSHEFLFDLCQRNSKMFYGNVVNEKCLGHGSGPATYFIPTLMSKDVKNVYNYWGEGSEFNDTGYFMRNENIFDHIMIAYTHDIDGYLNNINEDNPPSRTIIYTLSTIKKEWIPYVRENKIKDIISIFGTSETSGPLFLNYATDKNFVQNKFNLVDDYYKISFTEKNILEVDIPIYNRKLCTNDEFEIRNDGFYHNGRSDLIRINGHVVDIHSHNKILEVLSPYLDAKFVYDPAINEIYLAVWKNTLDLHILVDKINTKIGTICWAHHISKYEILNPNSFFTGIKMDNQLLRDYFRSNVEIKSNISNFILAHKDEYLNIFEGLECKNDQV
jgi:hypothetical protein